ncbi:MAG: hypothetical protein H6834_06310 [Planctomycetes bacterium]|nr:hypothetical protein [Planctomycetota bacterium]
MRSLLALVCFSSSLFAQTPTVSWADETMRLASASVTSQGSNWNVTLVMGDDNGNTSLPSTYRRWWHCRIGNLAPTGTTLNVRVTNAGYTDVILPVWSLSADGGATFSPYVRVPASALPSYAGGTHSFTLNTPPGVTTLRLAKYFPYTTADASTFLNSIQGHATGHVRRLTTLGFSSLGRAIQMVELTDASVPDTGKRRVWIHAGIHPAETTSYWIVEGLVGFLLSGDLRAEALLDGAIVNVVPMANPDGVFLGNYRTNAQSANLEEQWTAPYLSMQPEVVALRTQIESFMGTAAQPGANPIEILLNLHSTHGLGFPYHYRHVANASFDLVTNRTGVVPEVNALETAWIDAFRARSPFVDRGTTASSTMGAPTRPFVESMMHDRWSIDPSWTGAPHFLPRVMAITLEGTYARDPIGNAWNTPADYLQVGAEMALALADYLNVLPRIRATPFATGCSGATTLQGTFRTVQNVTILDVMASGAPPSSLGVLALGTSRIQVPLPPTGCPLVVLPGIVLPMPIDAFGQSVLSAALPMESLQIDLQFAAGLPQGASWSFFPSNGLAIESIR